MQKLTDAAAKPSVETGRGTGPVISGGTAQTKVVPASVRPEQPSMTGLCYGIWETYTRKMGSPIEAPHLRITAVSLVFAYYPLVTWNVMVPS